MNQKLSDIIKIEEKFERFSVKKVLTAIILTTLYLSWIIGLMTLRDDHIMLLAACLIGYFAHPASRRIFFGFVFILIYWFIYDSLRVYPNYLVNPVHITEPYYLEQAWFGILEAGKLLTPNEYFGIHHHTFLDVMSGIFYLSWVPVPIAFALYLYTVDRGLMLQFMFAFFLVNMIAIAIYYIYPAAPPWYVSRYGFDVHQFEIPGSAAGLIKFDQFFNVNIFGGMYAKNGNVFAAIPSMHSAFPILTTYYALKKKIYPAAVFFFFTIIGIWFAAVYTNHHYFIDVLTGGAAAIATILIMEGLLKSPAKQWYLSYKKLLY